MSSRALNVVFRLDASAEIGAGHVMRCLALARALAAGGDRCVFACRPASGDSLGLIAVSGFEVAPLPAAAPSPEAEAAAMGDALRALGVDHAEWLVVDHYGLGAGFESAARALAEKVLSVDDLAARIHDCDILLDHNLGAAASDYDGFVPAGATVLAGPRFALLRAQFAEAAAQAGERDGSVNRILVCFGGTDPTNDTEKALQALVLLGDTGLAVDVVLPEAAPRRAAAVALAATIPGVTPHGRVDDMASLMSEADLMVGAGGVTLLERAAVGLPSISIRTAENQAHGTRAAAAMGATLDLGPSADATAETIADELRDLLGDRGKVAEMARAARAAAGPEPGSGPLTVAWLMRCMAAPAEHARLRALRAEDSARLLVWRNSDRVRLAMSNQHVVGEDEHRKWFERVLQETPCSRFLFECGGVSLGFVSFASAAGEPGVGEWGFYVGEPWAPRGSGARLGILALDKAFGKLRLSEVRAAVLADNAVSLAFHERMGFRRSGTRQGMAPGGAAELTWELFRLTASDWRAARGRLASAYFGEDGLA